MLDIKKWAKFRKKKCFINPVRYRKSGSKDRNVLPILNLANEYAVAKWLFEHSAKLWTESNGNHIAANKIHSTDATASYNSWTTNTFQDAIRLS